MKFSVIFAVVVAAVFADESYLKEFSDKNVDYIGSLYKELLKKNTGNFIVCPLSIQTVFALVNSGAKGDTAKQITTALHLPEGEEEVKKIFTELTKTLQANDQYTLSSANKVYVANSFKIHSQYKSTAVDVFQSEIQNIDFNQAASAVKEINKWVEEKTHNHIHDLADENMIGPNTVAVLVNALYFQGTWESQFDQVVKKPFKLNNEKSVETEMMYVYQKTHHYHCPDIKASFLELPYKGGDVTMTIVLPDAVDGLAAVEEHIAHALGQPKYSQVPVNITIPKFKLETEIHLIPMLKNMGIVDAFTEKADFSGIGENQEKIIISEVIQKAFIDVNENGTTAAAATLISTERSDRQYDEVVFTADHPFLFYLKHRVAGVFFTGRFTQPEISKQGRGIALCCNHG